jgi:hypothetical protein
MKRIKTFENFLNEGNTSLGSKAKRFTDTIGEWDFYTDAGDTDGKMPAEYEAALKTADIKHEDAVVCFSGAVGSYDEILRVAKQSGITFVEVDDEETGEKAILFTSKQ